MKNNYLIDKSDNYIWNIIHINIIFKIIILWRNDMADYDIEDVINILKNLEKNPYSIKHINHLITRSRDRFIN